MKSATNSTQSVKLTLTVEPGKQLQFEVYDPKTSLATQCVYAVLRTRLVDNPMRATYGQKDNKFCIIYVGETTELSECIQQHKSETWFVENGATHVCFFEEHDPQARSALRSSLVKHYAPDCNHARDARIESDGK